MIVISRVNTISVFVATDILNKTWGVIGREHLILNGCFVIPSCNWVHTFFISRPLYVYFLSFDFSLVVHQEVVLPNSFSSFKPMAAHVIESFEIIDIETFEQICKIVPSIV